ncbi:hypothetical protein [Pseudomonas sp. 9Ag]|uniref:DUF6630 family protein n=1 Tax=Pseudomonas sp. 9Ag TaxID=2653167 RepID=UPI002115B79D|nr:hypothetical protein [Pseudomonas sp. 9Ag]
MPPPDETDLSDSACFKALRPDLPHQRRALKALTEAILARTPETERGRLVRRVIRKLDGGECASTALYEGLVDDKRGQKLEELALISVDWRGFDSFEYLAPYLVRASGIDTPFAYSHEGHGPMPDVLKALDAWLEPHDRRFVHLHPGSDSYVGFITLKARVPEILELAHAAAIEVRLESF